MLKRRVAVLNCAIVLALFAACDTTEPVCPLDPPQVQVVDDNRTLDVGQRFTPELTVRICGGGRPTDFVGFWRTTNRQVATVDSLSGSVLAVASGSAYIIAQYVDPSAPVSGTRDSILVTVR